MNGSQKQNFNFWVN